MNEQPRFDGPGIYGLVAYQDPSFTCNSCPIASGGFTPNELWQFALAQPGSGDKSKYVVLNVRNGYYLAVKSDDTIYCSNKTPTDDSALWLVSDVSQQSNGYHVFQVKSASGGQLTTPDGYSRGAKVVRGSASTGDDTKFYIVTRTPS